MYSCLTIEVKLGVNDVALISRLRVVNLAFSNDKIQGENFPSIK